MHQLLDEEGLPTQSMFSSYSDWNSSINNLVDYDGYEDICNSEVGSVFTTNHFHELTLPARAIGDEDIWLGQEIEENSINAIQRSCGSLSQAHVGQEAEYSLFNCWNNNDKEYQVSSRASNQNRFLSVQPNSLDICNSSSNNEGSYGGSVSDNSSVSHASTLNGVWIVPNINMNVQIGAGKSQIDSASSDDASSIETSISEMRRRIHFSRQKSDILASGTNIKLQGSSKCKNNEISMLIASGGAPLGKLDEIGGVEWYPERQSWKVVGHTGISWCVRRKTWRVWFIASSGTRATRSFNPKEHGTVAAALKAAIEFLENKRAEKSPAHKSLRGRVRRSSLYSNSFVSDAYSKSNGTLFNSKYKHVNNLVN
ncbi:AP2 domain-containing protein [Cryptosporidium felis]|nr:AP2 domain-containing protein [Cryptosporidium felis]